ncbi:serine-rich adhesin for platelets-like isoform X2 [Acropora millepora]|uniref:serine-rich adhesin for platelets-like isoform X2 n=1 Tax=Acropora millepora TaxID=45264 RepID=UPI001CF5EDB2|nr:serine-rich adhesin for platelets-like isoform X2 [Acropora millepora]
MSFNKRAFQRLFILLDKKLQAVPGKLENTRLENAGRVKEISFTKNCSASRIGRLLESSFSSLAGQDLSRLEFIASYSKGHSMAVVAKGLLNGEDLMKLYGGTRKKKVFLYLAPVSVSSTSTVTTSSLMPISSSNSTFTPTSAYLVASTSTSTSSIVTSLSISTTSTITTSIPTSTSTSSTSSIASATSTSPSTSSTPSVITSMPISTSTSFSSSTPASASVPSIDQDQVDFPSQFTPPVGGAATRRYLTMLAGAGGSTIPVYDDSDSDDQIEDVCSDQFNNNWSVVHLSSDNEDLGNDALSELEGGQEELRLNGYVTEDLSTPGVTSGDEFVSRLSEMLSCLEMLGNESQVITLSFLPHSFEEFIWQGTEDNTVMVAVLLKPSSSSANQDRCQKMITVLSDMKTSFCNCYFWIADIESMEAEKVKSKYAFKQLECAVLVLAPSLSKNKPQLVESFEGYDIDAKQFEEAILLSQQFCSSIREERKKLEEWRLDRWEQDQELKEMDNRDDAEVHEKDDGNDVEVQASDDEEEAKIRLARQNRLLPCQSGGSLIKACWGDQMFQRHFSKQALYQEVYDWLGSMAALPLYFSLYHPLDKTPIKHDEPIRGSERLYLHELTKNEAETVFNQTVSDAFSISIVVQNDQPLMERIMVAPYAFIRKDCQVLVCPYLVSSPATTISFTHFLGNKN